MKIFGLEIRKASKEEIANEQSSVIYNASMLNSTSLPMLNSAVYRCVEVLSNSLAQLELQTFDKDKEGYYKEAVEDDVYWMLSRQPNPYMSAYNFKKALIVSMLLRGNAYAYIDRNIKGEAIGLYYLDPSNVTIKWVTIKGIKRKRYQVIGFKDLVEPKDIIHILNMTTDGQNGMSTLAYARNTIEIAAANDNHVKTYFESGANVSGIISVDGVRMRKGQKEGIYETWSTRMNPTTGNKVPIVVLEGNQKYQPISLSPKDSQMLESRQFNVIDICRFFGVSPIKCFDLSKSSYSTVEASQIAFLNDSLAPLISKVEEEFNRKIFPRIYWKEKDIAFDITNMLRADKASQASYYNTMFQIGAISPNEIRKRMNLPRLKEGGDDTFVQVNVQTLKQVNDKNIDVIKKSN